MKIKELMEMATVAGGIATVSKPMGETQKRNQGVKVAGLEPAEKVMSGKAKKKGPYANSLSEGKMKDLALDLRSDKDGLSDAEFKKKYGMTKEEMRKSMKQKQVKEVDMSRRGFLGTLGKAGLAAAGAGLASKVQARVTPGQDDRGFGRGQPDNNDLGDGFELSYIEVAGHNVKAVLDKQTNTYYTLNRRPDGNGAIIRNMAPYIFVRNGQVNMASSVGPATAQAMRKAGLVEAVNEAELSEQDLIVVPGQKMKRKTGFIQHGQSRVDHEVEMARSDVLATMKNAKAIYEFLRNRSEDEGLEGWVQEKLIKANDYLNSVKEYYDEKMMQEMSGGVIAAGGVGESVVNKKFKSKQQAKLMYATAGGADTGVSKKVAKEFIKKSHGQKVGSLPKKVDKK